MKSMLEEGRHVVELRPVGIGRWITTGFLLFWLAGWAVGETFGLWMLGALLGALLGFQVPHQPKVPSGLAALGMFGFLLFWTGFWTLGGFGAAMTAMRSMWGVDRIEWDASAVKRTARVGRFGSTRIFSRDEIQRVRLRRGKGVALETTRGLVELTSFGADQDLAELRAEIEQALSLGDRAALPAELPKDWEAAVDVEGIPVLRKNPAMRRRQATFVTAIFLALALAVGILVAGGENGSHTPRWVSITVLGLLAAGVGLGAAWLWFGGEAIRLKPAHADVLRWFGSRRWLFEYASASIRIEHSVDGDGDDWYKLVLRGSYGAKTIAHCLRDSHELEQLGRWIAMRLGVELGMGSGLQGPAARG
jgi:hypothetical protein